ncbi:MAG TPA: alpha-amylase family glycosyl hydrolase [Bacillota bacterium]|nr:alpha-amylase family glycosyl hydrolase [Bacillota bacterium]
MSVVNFYYRTGVLGDIFRNARLLGSWDGNGRYSNTWSTSAMTQERAADGSPSFKATVTLDDSQVGTNFQWSVLLDGPGGANQWGIPTEVNDRNSNLCHREFRLVGGEQTEEYYLTHCRRLGANKYYVSGSNDPAILFSVWAPNAQKVELVRGSVQNGYIADDGTGITSSPGEFPMSKDERTGIWYTSIEQSPALKNFAGFDHTPYMFRIIKDDGSVAYRTDLYSRCQIGRGTNNPNGKHWNGTYHDLDGVVSCSVVVDPEKVTQDLDEPFPQQKWLTVDQFWRDEFNPLRPVPTRIEDYIIYELHVGGLAYDKKDQYGNPIPGDLRDAIKMLDYLVDLGINAVELLPLAEFNGWFNWGYGNSHYFAIEFSGGGRDEFKHFVRECHRRGIAVIIDVVYNHYTSDAERAEWMYDSNSPDKNNYYWYEGTPSQYGNFPAGGYVNNMSTGYAPRFWDEMVRKYFISSAVALTQEFHVDGFRVDQTTSIHSYPSLNYDGRRVDDACIFGSKFLRELTKTLRLSKPNVIMIAEDHSGWQAVTQPASQGGLGFDAIWYADFYHHLAGDTGKGMDYAKLIKTAGLGDNRPLAMDYFRGAFDYAGDHTVVYSESHDEVGNSSYCVENDSSCCVCCSEAPCDEERKKNCQNRDIRYSGRTIKVAVNCAPLVGETRRYAESRSRVAGGFTLLSPGIPMWFMGEEVGFQKEYRHDNFQYNREDFEGERAGNGRYLFRYYQDLIRLRKEHDALHSPNKDVLYVHNDNRVMAFRRWHGQEDFLVIASLHDQPFSNGYGISSSRLPDGQWREVFNSDSEHYNGNNVGNAGGVIASNNGYINAVVPANGVVVLQKM